MNVHEIITGQILSALDKGDIPWERPWKRTICENGLRFGVAPINLVSGRAYRGINVFLLGFTGYASPYWVSFKQAKELGGSVRKGEKGSLAVFWKWNEKRENGQVVTSTNSKGEVITEKIPCLRYYTVFNVEQCDGLKHKRLTAWAKSEEERKRREQERAEAIANGTWQVDDPQAPHADAEAAIAAYATGPTIRFDEPMERAYYSPSLDEVAMPARKLFRSQSAWYSTLFHELSHSTGHESRLARPSFTKGISAPFGSPEYAREELVAELGAAFLLGEVGLPVEIDDRAAYIANWRRALGQDVRLITVAAGQAQRAAERVLGREIGGGRKGDEAHDDAGMEPETVEQVPVGEAQQAA